MGTNFGPPLRWAQDQFKENPRADFLFITDGICNLENELITEFIQAKSQSRGKCYSVLIGSDTTETVKQFSDKVFSLTATLSASDGGQILAEL
jgi:uncharacterized protein with von Willebrand factor type A (vWA) domain